MSAWRGGDHVLGMAVLEEAAADISECACGAVRGRLVLPCLEDMATQSSKFRLRQESRKCAAVCLVQFVQKGTG